MRLLWVVTGVKPNFQVVNCRCESYAEFYSKMERATERRRADMSQSRYNSMILALQPLTEERVLRVSNRLLFDPSWMTKSKPKGKAKAAGGRREPSSRISYDPALDESFQDVLALEDGPRQEHGGMPASSHGEQVGLGGPSVWNGPPELHSRGVAPPTSAQAASSAPQQQPAPAAVEMESMAAPSGQFEGSVAVRLEALAARVAEQESAGGRIPAERLAVIEQNRLAALQRRAERLQASQQQSTAEAREGQQVFGSEPPEAPAQATEEEGQECSICKQDLRSKTRQAMECMHVFHSDCIQEYMEISGRPFRYACPFKCFREELDEAPTQAESST